MKKYSSESAFYQRLQDLAETKKSITKTNTNQNTLIDYKTANNNITYGIIKENHHYYIMKSQKTENPSIYDFMHISGLENKTKYQYDSISEADKQRNLMFGVINEGLKKRFVINEGDSAENDIEKATDAIEDLDAATEEEKISDIENDVVSDDTDNGMDDNQDTIETPDDEDGDGFKEIEKNVGKLTNKIRGLDMEPVQIKSILNSVISSFKDKLPQVDIEDRKEMSNKLMKVIGDENIEDLENTVDDNEVADEKKPIEENKCDECGSFVDFAQSKGYDKDSIKECGCEDMSNLVSTYANAHNDGNNDGDFETVSLFINPEVETSLRNDYGHDEYMDKVKPFAEKMNEDGFDKESKINELNWGNALKSVGSVFGDKIKSGANAIGDKVKSVGQEISKNYNTREVDSSVDKMENLATELAKLVAKYNASAGKSGNKPLNINSLTGVINNAIKSGGNVDLSRFKTTGSLEESIVTEEDSTITVDTDNTGEEDIETPIIPDEEIGFAPESDVLSDNKTVDVNINKEQGTINVTMNEERIKKYVKSKIFELMSDKKTNINESKKSEKLQKFDNLIKEEYDKFVEKKKRVNEVFGFSFDEKLAKLNPNDAAGINKLFYSTFTNILTNPQKGIIRQEYKQTTPDKLYSILQQYAKNPGGTLRLGNDGLIYASKEVKDKAIRSKFAGGGTQGQMSYGGTTNVDEVMGMVNEFLGLTLKEKLAKINPQDENAINKLFNSTFSNIIRQLHFEDDMLEATNENKMEMLRLKTQYPDGTIRLGANGFVFKKTRNLRSGFAGGGTGGNPTGPTTGA